MINWNEVKHVVCIRGTHELIKGQVYTLRAYVPSQPKVRLSRKTGKCIRNTDKIIDRVKVCETTQRYTPLGVKVPPPYNDLGFYVGYFKPLKRIEVKDFVTKEALINA